MNCLVSLLITSLAIITPITRNTKLVFFHYFETEISSGTQEGMKKQPMYSMHIIVAVLFVFCDLTTVVLAMIDNCFAPF